MRMPSAESLPPLCLPGPQWLLVSRSVASPTLVCPAGAPTLRIMPFYRDNLERVRLHGVCRLAAHIDECGGQSESSAANLLRELATQSSHIFEACILAQAHIGLDGTLQPPNFNTQNVNEQFLGFCNIFTGNRQQAARYREQVDRMAEQLRRASRSYNALLEQHSTLSCQQQNEQKQRGESLTRLQHAVAQRNDQLSLLQKEYTKRLQGIQSHNRKQMTIYQDNQRRLQDQYQEAMSDNARLKTQLARLENEISSVNAQIKQCVDTIRSEKSQFSQKKQSLDECVVKLDRAIKVQENACSVGQYQLDKSAKELLERRVSNEVSKQKQTLQTINTQINDLIKKIGRVRTQIYEAERDRERLLGERKGLNEEEPEQDSSITWKMNERHEQRNAHLRALLKTLEGACH